jgi:acetoin utilization deacetylase AcuC-like enzyme
MTTAFISHRDCKLHDMGAQHPECPARLDAIHDQLIASGLDAYLTPIEAPLATMDQFAACASTGLHRLYPCEQPDTWHCAS